MAPVSQALTPSRAYGAERIPTSGGLVIAVNHFATIDPILAGVFCTRSIYFMAKLELLDVPVAGEILRWLGAFAVRRGEGDRDALRVARWVAAEGHTAGFFMEGTRQKLGYPTPGHPGAAMIAIQEEVPVVPCGIDTFQWTLRNRRRCASSGASRLTWAACPERPQVQEGPDRGREILRLWRQAAQAVVDGFRRRSTTARCGTGT
jgi:1-acyl-sn-glycerol-3-phosphate acyltransferase